MMMQEILSRQESSVMSIEWLQTPAVISIGLRAISYANQKDTKYGATSVLVSVFYFWVDKK